MGELLERILDLGVVQPHRDEASLLVGGVAEEGGVALEGHPVGGEGLGGHGQHQGARGFQPPFDGQRDGIAGPDHPLIEPDPQPIPLQPLGQLPHRRPVPGAMAEEDVVFEVLRHLLVRPTTEYAEFLVIS